MIIVKTGRTHVLLPPWQKYQPGGIATEARVLILCKTYGERHGATNSAIRGAVGQRNSKILQDSMISRLFHLEFCVSGIPNRQLEFFRSWSFWDLFWTWIVTRSRGLPILLLNKLLRSLIWDYHVLEGEFVASLTIWPRINDGFGNTVLNKTSTLQLKGRVWVRKIPLR